LSKKGCLENPDQAIEVAGDIDARLAELSPQVWTKP
jgi:hypothetical protein